MNVAVGRQGLHLARSHTQQGHVERAATQVRDHDSEFLPRLTAGREMALRIAKSESNGRRFVDDVQHPQAGHLACVGGGLAAHLVKIAWHRDHGPHVRSQGTDQIVLEFPQDQA